MRAVYARNRSILRPVLLLVLVVLPLCLGAACTSTKWMQAPAPAWVQSARATHDVIAPRFRAYIDADVTLSVEERVDLHNLLADWNLNIQVSEQAIAELGAGQ